MAGSTPTVAATNSDDVKTRLLQVAEWLKLDKPPISYNTDGSVQQDAALLAWCKTGGVSLNWVFYGDAESMVIAQQRQYERERHFCEELKKFEPAEHHSYEVLKDFDLLEPSFYELLKGYDPEEQRFLLEGLQDERDNSVDKSGVVFEFIIKMIAYRKSPANPTGKGPKDSPLGSNER